MENKNELRLVRVFDAPLAKVWQSWSDPGIIKKWWGPKYFTAPYAKIDFRVGGKNLLCMHGAPTPGAEEVDFWSTGEYKEIIPMEKIVVTDSFADKDGNVVPASYYGMGESFPKELLVTLTFKDLGDKTELTLVHSGIENLDETNRSGMKDGWTTTLDKLAASLS